MEVYERLCVARNEGCYTKKVMSLKGVSAEGNGGDGGSGRQL